MKGKSFLAAALVLVLVLVMAMPVFAEKPAVEGKYLDDFERASYDNSGGSLNDGTGIYWQQSFGGNTLAIKDGILNADMKSGGCIRWATSNSDSFSYVLIRMKGDSKAVNDKFYTRIGDASDATKALDDGSPAEKAFSDLKGTNGKALPAVSSEFQVFVIDLAKSGLKLGGPGAANGFQLGVWQDMKLDIDYVFMTNTVPAAPAAAEAAETDVTAANPKTGDSTPIIPAAIVLIISAAMIVILGKRKKAEC